MATRAPFQTLNGELVLIAPYGVERSSNSAVFNGIFQVPALNAKSLMLPKLTVLLLQIAGFKYTEGTVPIVYGF